MLVHPRVARRRPTEAAVKELLPASNNSRYAADAERQTQLLIALETKAQQLCDDTRAQYEQMLQRQETRHEQQQTSLQHKLQQVLQTSISLGEHEQLMAMQTEAHKREREQHTQRQTQELSQLQEQWKQYWQLRLRDLEHQHEQQLEQLEERLAQSELAAAEALHWAKQHELETLAVCNQLEDSEHVREKAEARVDQACIHIQSLKRELQKLEPLRRRLEMAQEQTQHVRLEMAQLKGETSQRQMACESELVRLREALAQESQRTQELQQQLTPLYERLRELETSVTQLSTKEAAFEQMRQAERAQSGNSIAELRQRLQAEQTQRKTFEQQLSAHKQSFMQTQLKLQELRTLLQTANTQQTHSQQRHRQQTEALRTRLAQLQTLAKRLKRENQELRHETHLSGLLWDEASREVPKPSKRHYRI